MECPLNDVRIVVGKKWINVANIQIISSVTKHHSKQLWISACTVNVLTICSVSCELFIIDFNEDLSLYAIISSIRDDVTSNQ